MKENSPNKLEKSSVVYNQVAVRLMINMNLKNQKIKENRQGLLLELIKISMEDLVVRILLNLDTIMKISLGLADVMIHIQRDRLLTPVKLEMPKRMRIKLKKSKI